MLDILIGTFTMRPYVFAFFAAYLLAAVTHIGWKKTALFTVAGYLIAFVSEFSSINNGFPYGWYYYIDTTKDRELWIAGVPFFDSLSYVFLAYCSWATALFILSPLKRSGLDLVTLETRGVRHSVAALFLGGLLQVCLDIIIDPVALQGRRWFLGQIYGYNEAGVHFGVPLSNYGGWFLVGLVMMGALQLVDRMDKGKGKKPAGVANLPFRSLLGPVLYVSVLLFNLGMTLYIGEQLMATTGIFMYVLPVCIVAILAARRINRYSRKELEEHLRDYPWSRASCAGE